MKVSKQREKNKLWRGNASNSTANTQQKPKYASDIQNQEMTARGKRALDVLILFPSGFVPVVSSNKLFINVHHIQRDRRSPIQAVEELQTTFWGKKQTKTDHTRQTEEQNFE